MRTCGASAPTSCSRCRAPSRSASPPAVPGARSTRPRCASCSSCWSETRAPWSTRAARDATKAHASGEPTGAAPRRDHTSPIDLMLNPDTLPAIQRALADADLDGWLLYDFQGTNPIAGGMIGLEGMVTRRIFVWIPAEGMPSALGHAIEPGPWRKWPKHWPHSSYSSWRQLEDS